MDDCTFDFAVTGSVPRSDSQIERAKRMAVGGGRKRCRKGKSCSATCIFAGKVCLVDLPWVVSGALSKVRGRIQKGAPLTPEEKTKSLKGDLGAMFAKAIQKGKEEQKPASLPSDLRRELFALPGPDIASAAKKGDMTLMMDDISRIMRGSLPQNLEVASAGNELGMKARLKGSGTQAGSATGNTRWARDDAKDFDGSFKIYKRIRGDKDMIDWDQTARNGIPIGEGSFGTVLRSGNMAIKRGEVGAEEANIIKRVGQAGIGPKLHGAEISTKIRDGYGVNIHNGRIAMSIVPGKEMGDVGATTKFAGKNAADVYWKAMAELHRLGIAHNDAHPHNIMVDNTGKGRWVDMGLAQQSPKAALAEALGAFSRNAKGEGGNWQTRDWKATGINAYRQAQTDRKTARFAKEHPVLGRVINNISGVQSTLMKKYGLSPDELKQVMNQSIRSPLETYNKGVWSKLTDRQAQDLLNTLYDGI
jgi:tRNA A-37 threonylcarbamoyl transferase component Bud32